MKQISLRLPEDLAAEVEVARGQVPRERWIRGLIQDAVEGVTAVPSMAETIDAKRVVNAAMGAALDFKHGSTVSARQQKLNDAKEKARRGR